MAEIGNKAEVVRMDRRACRAGLAEIDKKAKTAKWPEKSK